MRAHMSSVLNSAKWVSQHTPELGILYTVLQYVAAKTAFAGIMRTLGLFQSKPVGALDLASALAAYEMHEFLTPHEKKVFFS